MARSSSRSRSRSREPSSDRRSSSESSRGSRRSRRSRSASQAESGEDGVIRESSSKSFRIPKRSASSSNYPAAPMVEAATTRPESPVSAEQMKLFTEMAQGNGWTSVQLTDFINRTPAPGGSPLAYAPCIDRALRPKGSLRRVEASWSYVGTLHNCALAIAANIVTAGSLIEAGDPAKAHEYLMASTHLVAGQVSAFIHLERETVLRSHGVPIQPISNELRDARIQRESLQVQADGSSRINLFGETVLKAIEESSGSSDLLSKIKPKTARPQYRKRGRSVSPPQFKRPREANQRGAHRNGPYGKQRNKPKEAAGQKFKPQRKAK